MTKHTLFEKEVFECFIRPGEVCEVRIPGRPTMAGYYDDHELFAKHVRQADKQAKGNIYFTLQVIDHRLLARALNRMLPLKATTTDRDVLAYRWLPVDLDPIRPAGISSSDSELEAALVLRDQIADDISAEYELDPPIRATSGNGAHLLYPLPDLPAKKYAEAVKGMLLEISSKYSNDRVNIDSNVFNPARIWKVYGTTARKGDPLPARNRHEARPHRTSHIDFIPKELFA